MNGMQRYGFRYFFASFSWKKGKQYVKELIQTDEAGTNIIMNPGSSPEWSSSVGDLFTHFIESIHDAPTVPQELGCSLDFSISQVGGDYCWEGLVVPPLQELSNRKAFVTVIVYFPWLWADIIYNEKRHFADLRELVPAVPRHFGDI